MPTSNICNYDPIGSLSVRAIDNKFKTIHRSLCYIQSVIGGGSLYTFSTGLTNTGGTITANLSTGVAGGQSAIGGTSASNNLTLSSTSSGTKGKILFGTSAYDESTNRLGLGTASPSSILHLLGTGIVQETVQSTNATDHSRITFSNQADATIGGQLLFGGNSSGFTPGGLMISSSKNFMAVTCEQGDIRFTKSTIINGANEHARFLNNGNLGIGVTAPSAYLHIKAGTATAGTAPIKLTAGTNLGTPEDGAFEFDGTNLYFTVGGVRKTVTLV